MHEEWKPEDGKRGRVLDETGEPWSFTSGKSRMERAVARTLGDQMCRMCPKWDADREQPKASIGAFGAALLQVASLCHRTGALPHAGGLLDQDPEMMDLLDTVYRSNWWKAARS